MAEAIGVIASVAGIAQAGVQLSQGLYHIATRLVNAPKQVAEVADELTLLSKIFGNLGDTLEKARKLCKEEIIDHAKSILDRFEALQKDVTALVKKIKGIERLKYAFGMSSIADLMAKIGALKSSMCLLLSTMHIAIETQKTKRPKKRKSSKVSPEDEVAEQSRLLAEAYIESVRHAIIRLKARAQRKAKEPSKQENTLTFRYWSESLDDTAHWLFDMVFTPYQRARNPLDHAEQPRGRARTIKSAKADAPASDSGDGIDQNQSEAAAARPSISVNSVSSKDPTHELEMMTNTTEIANELLRTWTNLSKEQIEDTAHWSALKADGSWDRTLNRLIRACIHDNNVVTAPELSDVSFDGHANSSVGRSRAGDSGKLANTPKRFVRPFAPFAPPGRLEREDNSSSAADAQDIPKGAKEHPKDEVYFEKHNGIFIPQNANARSSASKNTEKISGDDDAHTVFTIATSVAEAVQSSSTQAGVKSPEGKRTERVPDSSLGSDRSDRGRKGEIDDLHIEEWGMGTVGTREDKMDAIVEEVESDIQSTKTQAPKPSRRRETKLRWNEKTETIETIPPGEAYRLEAKSREAASAKSNLSARKVLPQRSSALEPSLDNSESGDEEDEEESDGFVDQDKWTVPYGSFPYGYPLGTGYPPPPYYANPFTTPPPMPYTASHSSASPLPKTRISELEERLKDTTEELKRKEATLRATNVKHAEEVAVLRRSAEARSAENAAQSDKRIRELEALINRSNEESKARHEDSKARQEAINAERSKLITELDAKLHSALQVAQVQAMAGIADARKEITDQYELKLFAINRDLAEANEKASENQRLLDAAQERAKDVQKELEAVQGQLSQRDEERTKYNPWQYHEVSKLSIPSESESSSAGSTVTESQTDGQPTTDGGAPRERGETAPSSSTAESPTSPNFIVFPGREGWGLNEKTELNSSLEKYGFKPLFEDHAVAPGTVNNDYPQRPGSGGSPLRGTLFWEPTRSPTVSEVYRSLLTCGWRPLYMRANKAGQTWFLGCQPVHVNFFKPWYIPQLQPADPSNISSGSAEECLILGTECVDPEALNHLGFEYRKLESGRVLLDPRMTSLDIDHVVALSFLLREGVQRKNFRDLELSRPALTHQISEVSNSNESEPRPSSVQSAEKPVKGRRLLARFRSNPLRSTSDTLIDPVHLK